MPSDKSELHQISTNIICPGCGAVGVIIWETIDGKRSLVRLSRIFYERLARKTPYPIELVCYDCGTIQPEITV
jgi:hypothetical protein